MPAPASFALSSISLTISANLPPSLMALAAEVLSAASSASSFPVATFCASLARVSETPKRKLTARSILLPTVFSETDFSLPISGNISNTRSLTSSASGRLSGLRLIGMGLRGSFRGSVSNACFGASFSMASTAGLSISSKELCFAAAFCF